VQVGHVADDPVQAASFGYQQPFRILAATYDVGRQDDHDLAPFLGLGPVAEGGP
jgi:hypothetical protein